MVRWGKDVTEYHGLNDINNETQQKVIKQNLLCGETWRII